ncbi:MAG: amidohydrolase family protein [Ruminococcus sp.]|nr:amidohydrolase family protein [Ruminococcus sp.]
MNSFVLHGDICFCPTPKRLLAIEDGYVVVRDGVTELCCGALPDTAKELPLHDYRSKLVFPGMVDLHVHAPQYAFRGLGADMELLEWLRHYAFPEEAKYGDLRYADKAYSMFTGALKNSATTRAVIFGSLHHDATKLLMDKMEDSGVVSYVGKVNMDRNSPDNLCETTEESYRSAERIIRETAGKYRNTKPILTPRFVPSCTDELLNRLGRLAEKEDVPVQSHLSENPEEIKWVARLCPDSRFYGEVYDKYGLFGSSTPTVMAHCVFSGDEEIALMKERGVYIAHCPASNMNVGSGIAPISRYMREGLSVGLGSDIAGGQSESIFTAMVEAMQLSRLYRRHIDGESTPLTFAQTLYMATKGGGQFFGKAGSFERGYEFDAIVIDDSTLPHPQPLTLAQRAERAVWLSGDKTGLIAKYVRGNRIL